MKRLVNYIKIAFIFILILKQKSLPRILPIYERYLAFKNHVPII